MLIRATVNSDPNPRIDPFAAALALLLASLGTACSQEPSTAPASPGEDPVAWPTDGWPTAGGNLYNQRYSPLTEINRDNVAQLKGVSRTRLGGSGGARKYSGEAQPLVYEGVAYIVTGQPLIGIEERPVPQEPRHLTAPTQPYPAGDSFVNQFMDIAPAEYPPLVNQGRIFTPFWTDGTIAVPGPFGGANWPPSAYDPGSGTLFVCANERPGFFRGGEMENDLPEMPGDAYIGGFFGNVPFPNNGILAAMDMRTNTIVWRQRWQQFCYSGVLATAGGLLFTGKGDGRLVALDSSDGALLWEFQTGAGMNAPVSTFEHDGEQYVIAYSAGNLFAGTPRGDSVWLFSLSGTLDEAGPAGSEPVVSEAEHE